MLRKAEGLKHSYSTARAGSLADTVESRTLDIQAVLSRPGKI